MNVALLLCSDADLAGEVRRAWEAMPSSPALLHYATREEVDQALATLGGVELVLFAPASRPPRLAEPAPLVGVLEPGEDKPEGLPCLERPVRASAVSTLRDLLRHTPRAPAMAPARERALARFFSGIAHDINNRLTTLTGYISMLPEMIAGEEEMIRDMETAADAAGDLVRQLQALKDNERLPPRSVDLGALLMSLRDLSRRLVHPDTPLTLSWPGPGLWIKGDPASLEFLVIGGLSWFAGRDAPVASTVETAEDGSVHLVFASEAPLAFPRESAWRRDRPAFEQVVVALGADWEIDTHALRFHFQPAPPPDPAP